MTETNSLFGAIKTDGFTALSGFDPKNEEHILATLVLAGDEDDLSVLEPHLKELPKLLNTRVIADCDPDRIDAEFSKSTFDRLSDLIRVGLDWTHHALSKAPEELLSWMTLDDERTYHMRGEDYSAELPYSIACAMDPLEFAKQIWHGEGTLGWIEDPVTVADVLCRLNGSSWIIALAILSENDDHEAFQMAAEAAVFSAAAASTAENSNDFYYRLAEGNLDHDPTFDLIYAAIEDVEEQAVLVQSASVEILTRRNFEHPAIDGAPLSGSEYDDSELDSARNIIGRRDKTPSEKVQRARLYSEIITTDFDEQEALMGDLPRSNHAVAIFLGDEETLFQTALGDSLLALGAIELILQKNSVSLSLKLLESCSLFRVDYIRNRLAFLMD